METEASAGRSFGPALRAARRDRGLSLGQLARMVNYSKSHLSRVETEDKAPTDMLARRCDEVLHTGGRLSRLARAARPGRRAPSLNQLPRAVPWLIGRAALLSTLDTTLPVPADRRDSAQTTVVVLDGHAGIGKTATASHWAHSVARRFPDGVLFTDLGGFGPGTPVAAADVLHHFLLSLGGQVDASLSTEHLAARYRGLMVGKRVLVVLDNAASAGQVRPLLPAGSGCHVLVTSRDRLSGLVARDGARRVTVPPMTQDEAWELLESVAGPGLDRQTAAEVARSCGYSPLALRIAAEDSTGRPSSPLNGRCGGKDDATSLRAVLSWSYRGLSPAAAKALRNLAVLGDVSISPVTVAGLLGTSESEADSLLDSLAEVHLLHQTVPGTYRLDPLTAAFAAEGGDVRPLRAVSGRAHPLPEPPHAAPGISEPAEKR